MMTQSDGRGSDDTVRCGGSNDTVGVVMTQSHGEGSIDIVREGGTVITQSEDDRVKG